ncbi:hypothetical protein ACH5RR_023356 [Cinchona calisaya]|uniref:Endonuclease/exonuclease/phosphatase domain-containing protein n=1 Tax=Cinchona calisaya TaxID=153742 RepID=A0ABD2ZBJ4_9GENT
MVEQLAKASLELMATGSQGPLLWGGDFNVTAKHDEYIGSGFMSSEPWFGGNVWKCIDCILVNQDWLSIF